MPSIDERVVEMKFKDDQFKKGISGTTKALGDLKKGLDLKGAASGLQEVDKAGRNLKLDHIANGIAGLQSKFSALSIAGITALTNIANRAVNTGVTLVKSLTIDPVKTGLDEYETQLNAIQTILANTGLEGDEGLGKVNNALGELNTYADKTIYNFTEMARNIGTFTAAGVDLDTSTSAIKGIANLAAVSGSTSQQASTAMYQLSQALAAGKVNLMDWNSVVNAGMGGKVFQDALIETAKVQGIAVDDMIKKEGSFRESLTKHGWLTAEVLTDTLAKFTGDLSEEQLKQQGYNDQQIKDIQKLGAMSNDAATKVKTLSQLMETLQEAAQSGWTQSWELIFGDFNEAKELFTGVSDTIGGIIGESNDARNAILKDWKGLGGRDLAVQAIADAFKALMAVIKPVKDAFRDIFPATTGKDLYNFTKALADFVKSLTIGEEAANNLRRTFRGVFAVLDIGWMIIKGLAGVLGDLIGVIFEGSGGFLEFTGSIGDWLVSIRDAIKNGEGLTKFFDGLSAVLKKPIEWLMALGRVIGDLFSGMGGGGENGLAKSLNPIALIGKTLTTIFSGLWEMIKAIGRFIAPLAGEIGNFLADLFSNMGDSLGDLNFDHILGLINTGLFAGLVVLFKNFLGGGWLDQIKGMFSSGGESGGLVDSIKGIFGGLTDTLSAMQANLKAGTLIKIAGAIALLTASILVLSTIDAAKLGKALGAITIMFVQLGAAMFMFEKFSSGAGFIRMPFIAASLILLSVAVLILSAAVKNLADLDWDELARGLVGVGGLLASLNLFMAFAKAQKGAIRNGAGLILLGVAINILASAVGKFAKLSWKELAKGVGTLTALLGILGLYGAMTSKLGGASGGVQLILMATALNILLKPLKEFSQMEWGEIAKAMVMLAGSLALLVGATYLMTGALPGAAAMIVMAAAITILAKPLQEFGQMEWKEIGKAMVVLAGSLVILAGAAYLMTAALPGAAAMLVMAFAIRTLAPAIIALGEMEWSEILRSLVMLAGALTVLGIAGVLILPAIPGLLLLGVALTLLGAGTLLAGTGLMLFATALGLLAVTGGAAVAVLITSVKGLLGLIPYAAEQLALGFQAFVTALADNTVAITEAFVKIGLAILDGINRLAPQIVSTLVGLIWLLVNTIRDNVGEFVQAGADIIIGFLNGLAANMGGIITAGTDVVVAFLQGIQDNQGKVADEGADTVIGFVNSVAATIETKSGEMQAAGGRLALAIADGMSFGLASKVGELGAKAAEMANSVIGRAKAALGINSPSKVFTEIGQFTADGFAIGMDNRANRVGKAADNLGGSAISAVKSAVAGISTALDSDIASHPTITPVLDLSNVRKGAGEISGMMAGSRIDASVSRDRANVVSGQMNIEPTDLDKDSIDPGPRSVTFIQNNTSPKSLSASEIYRKTSNQISQVKEIIGAK